jgi:hypothetical protein
VSWEGLFTGRAIHFEHLLQPKHPIVGAEGHRKPEPIHYSGLFLSRETEMSLLIESAEFGEEIDFV